MSGRHSGGSRELLFHYLCASYHKHKAEGKLKAMWGNKHRKSTVTGFLCQGHTFQPSLNSTTNWALVLEYMSLCGTFLNQTNTDVILLKYVFKSYSSYQGMTVSTRSYVPSCGLWSNTFPQPIPQRTESSIQTLCSKPTEINGPSPVRFL